MDATALLIADHNRVRGLFARWQAAADAGEMATALEISALIIKELQVHTRIEEETFYPAVHELSDEIGETVDEGLEEHHVVDRLIEEIQALDPDDPRWKAKMTVLVENVEHHAGEEEEELFPAVRGQLDAAVLESLGQKLEDDKRRHGVGTATDNADRTVEDLRRQATEEQIPGRSKMSSDELAATVTPAPRGSR